MINLRWMNNPIKSPCPTEPLCPERLEGGEWHVAWSLLIGYRAESRTLMSDARLATSWRQVRSTPTIHR